MGGYTFKAGFISQEPGDHRAKLVIVVAGLTQDRKTGKIWGHEKERESLILISG